MERLDLFEYQGKELFARNGIPVPSGETAETPAEARAAAERIGGTVVVKAQVQVGGRGKAGGIQLAANPDEAEARAKDILGMDIKGHTVHRVWVESASEIEKEYYASITFDRSAKKPLVMLSAMGGVDIEAVAAEHPDKLARLHVDPLSGFHPHHARRLCYEAGIDDVAMRGVQDILLKLYQGFTDLDAMLFEVNPLILTKGGDVIALDAKVTIDNNALYRHPDIAALQESTTEDPQERMAQEKGVTYVKLDGDVGILGNGAGLVMSTLDVVALAERPSGQLPGRRRRIPGRRGRRRARGPPVGPEGQVAPHQHLRWHHPLRRGGRGSPHRHRPARFHHSDRRPSRRHQRG